MTNQNCLTSACRYCRFYRPEGLLRGACQQLSVSVHSDWKACQLALPAFSNTWENAEELTTANWQAELPTILHGVELGGVALDLANNSLSANNINN